MKITLLQLTLNNNYEKNIEKAYNCIKDACEEHKPDFILLPGFFIGYPIEGQYECLLSYGEGVIKNICSLARQFKVHIIAGSILEEYKSKLYVSSYMIGYDGLVLGVSKKLYDAKGLEHADEFPVFDTIFGKVGIVLDNDLMTVEIPRILALKGAEIIFVPGATHKWNKEQTKDSIWGISVLNCTAIAYCSSVSEEVLYGGSIITAPQRIVTQADYYGRNILNGIIGDDEIPKLRQPDVTLKNTLWWVLKGRKPELYNEIIPKVSTKGIFCK